LLIRRALSHVDGDASSHHQANHPALSYGFCEAGSDTVDSLGPSSIKIGQLNAFRGFYKPVALADVAGSIAACQQTTRPIIVLPVELLCHQSPV
jgi:hypothetical protein